MGSQWVLVTKMPETSTLKCRFCKFTTPAIYTGRDGKTRSGWNRLQSHIESRHEDQAMEIHEAAPTTRSIEAEEIRG